MKTKIVYVLVSSDSDIYLEQAYVSMYSLKFYMPESHIVLLTDVQSEKTFVGIRKQELKYVDELVTVDLGGECLTAQQRSRLLKTGVRLYVTGDFLFVDCDTIITRPLKDVDDIDADIAACWDSHALLHESPQYLKVIKDCREIGVNVQEEEFYFNSGVIYVRDNEITRLFYEKWQTSMKESQKVGVNMDQPSFAKTNIQMKHIVKRLDDVWNCELKYGIRFLKDAKIVHYLCTNHSHNKDTQFFIMNDYTVLAEIKKTGTIPLDICDTIRDPFCGIAKVTHCFAGVDVFFFETTGFHILRSLYDTRFFSFSVFVLRIINKLNSYFKIRD